METHAKSTQTRMVILVILCSMTEDRFEICKEVLKSLRVIEDESNFQIIVIDNGSKFKVSRDQLPHKSRYIEMPYNLGYWGLLYWFIFSNNSPFQELRTEYIYFVESDHIHFNCGALKTVVQVMDAYPKIMSTRVQEFSVRRKWLFSKDLKFFPFRVKRSIVSLRDLVTGKRVKFMPTKLAPKFYFANWHAKLPSVFRTHAIEIAFRNLAELGSFTEYDFFVEMHNQSESILVLDNGIYFPKSSARNSSKVLSGSWMNNYKGKFSDYLPTRVSSLRNEILNESPIHDSYR